MSRSRTAALLLVLSSGWETALAQSDGAIGPLSAAPADTSIVWQVMIGGFVVFAFLGSIIVWVATALSKARRINSRRAAFVSSALNNLSHGIVMLDAHKRIVFCNDSYLSIYGFSRADIRKGMTGRDLLDMRKDRGSLGVSIDDYYLLSQCRTIRRLRLRTERWPSDPDQAPQAGQWGCRIHP